MKTLSSKNANQNVKALKIVLNFIIAFLIIVLVSEILRFKELFVSEMQSVRELEKKCSKTRDKKVFFARWNRFPIEMGIDSSVPEEARISIIRAASKWSNVLGFKVFEFNPVRNKPFSSFDNQSVIYFVHKDWRGEKSYEAETFSRFLPGSGIGIEADVLVNASDYRYSYDLAENGKIDFESLILHELGHVLGIDHIDNGGVMNAFLAAGVVRRDLDQETIEVGSCIYSSFPRQVLLAQRNY